MSLNMPNSYCALLVFFLFLSLHACNARLLGGIDKTKLEKKFHIFNKNDAKKGLEKIPVLHQAKSSLSSEVIGGERGERNITDKSLADKTQKPKDTKAKQKISNDEKVKTTTSGAVQTESLTSVSWRVPHSKLSEKHPVFNSDYSPPKTHPPSHN